jgi:hypothetical protein
MTPEEIRTVLDKHAAWLRGDDNGIRADLRGAYLGGANLRGAYLRGAYLGGANLGGANLGGADLRGAYLRGANLGGANLRNANLGGANLRGADLGSADLGSADLESADLGSAYLRGANLGSAYLRGADLRGAYLPAPPVLLLASWGEVSDALTVDLMRYDATCHPDPARFDAWAAGGECPYEGVRVQRAALFKERRDLWSPGPSPRPHDLMARVLAEKCPPWTEEQAAAFAAKFPPKT